MYLTLLLLFDQYLNHFGENYKEHDFKDPSLLGKWGGLRDYSYMGHLQQVGPDDAAVQPGGSRDFPEARERLKAKGLLK